MPSGIATIDPLAIIESRSIMQNGCRIWQGGTNSQGYGKIKVTGKVWQVHRLVYILLNGDTNNFVLHKCDTPLCNLPEHLYEGTPSDNMQDKYNRKRQSNKGEKNPNSILTEELVKQIRKDYETGLFNKTQLAIGYNVSRATIINVLAQRSWTA